MATTLGKSRVHTLSLQYALYGGWKADMTLEEGSPPADGAALTLTVGTLVLRGVVVRANEASPAKPRVILQGGTGWEREIARPLSWYEPSGVRLRNVIADIAAEAGQEVEFPTDQVIGDHYEVIGTSAADPLTYADALNELADDGVVGRYRVDPDGITRFGPRPGVEVTSRATVLGRDGGPGYLSLGIDDPKLFIPGNTISGAPIVRLVVKESAGNLTAETWTVAPNAAPSIRTSVRRMVQRYLQEFVRTYVVAAVSNAGLLDLVPPADAQHLPELAGVPFWTLGGARVIPAVGTEVLVLYRDRRRSRPVAIAFGPGTPDDLLLDADENMYIGPNADDIVIRQGTLPVGRGGAKIALTGAAGAGELKVTTPDGTVHRWTIGATAFTVTPIPPNTGEVTIDSGTPEVLV